MATKSTSIRNAQCLAATENLDRCEYLTSTDQVLVTFEISFSAPSSGQASLTEAASAQGAASGNVATARFYDSGSSGDEITGVTVSTSDADIIVTNTSIADGQDVELEAFTYTVPAETA